MTFLPRLIVVVLAVFGAVNIVASMTLAVCWRPPAGSATARSSALFRLRLLPATASLVAAIIALAAFIQFEPRDGLEDTGLILPALAAAAAAVGATMLLKMAGRQWTSRQALRRWLISARTTTLRGVARPVLVVDAAFPVVAVVGLFRQRLVFASSVLQHCSESEMNMILAHEGWHLRRRDNIRRTLLAALPDVLDWLPWSRRLTDAWQVASEEAADDAAVRSGRSGRLHLAEALIRVARLASQQTPQKYLPASALYRGGSVEHRVRRVLDEKQDVGVGSRRWPAISAGAALLLIVCLLNLRSIQRLVEIAVSQLP